MGLEADFLNLVASTSAVEFEPLTTHSNYGAPSYGTAVQVPTVIDMTPRLVSVASGREGIAGREELAKGMLYVLSTSLSIGPQDRLTVRGDEVKILSVRNPEDDEGQHHLEVAIR